MSKNEKALFKRGDVVEDTRDGSIYILKDSTDRYTALVLRSIII